MIPVCIVYFISFDNRMKRFLLDNKLVSSSNHSIKMLQNCIQRTKQSTLWSINSWNIDNGIQTKEHLEINLEMKTYVQA